MNVTPAPVNDQKLEPDELAGALTKLGIEYKPIEAMAAPEIIQALSKIRSACIADQAGVPDCVIVYGIRLIRTQRSAAALRHNKNKAPEAGPKAGSLSLEDF